MARPFFETLRELIHELAAIHALRDGPAWPEVLTLEVCMRLRARAREIRDALTGFGYPLPAIHESDQADYDRLQGRPPQPPYRRRGSSHE